MEIGLRDISQKSLRRSNRRRQPPASSDSQTTTAQLEEIVRGQLNTIYPDAAQAMQPVAAVDKKFAVSLHYGCYTLVHSFPSGTSFRRLKYLLLALIFHHEERTKHSESALQTVARIVGFQSAPSDIPLDYRLSMENGELSKSLQLECVLYSDAPQLGRYQIIKCLAIGGFSKVYLVRSLLDGRFLAMKVMDKRFIFSNEKESVVENEKNICSQLDHPFVVRMEHSFETRNFTFFVMECKQAVIADCPGGELFYLLKRVKRMSENDARFYFTEILYGLQYLHEKGIVYRDLKPENLLIAEDGHIKIADFGLSKAGMNRESLTYSYCGSAEYMPPEMIMRSGHGFGVDYYTLGALLYELVTGLPPYYSRDENKIRDAILYEPLVFPCHLQLSEQLKNLLAGLLNKNYKMRLGCLRGIKEILFHPWMGKIDGKTILQKGRQPPHLPNLTELNFDENELGEDEVEFTAKVRRQARQKDHLRKRHFPGIEYNSNFSGLNQEHRKLLSSCEEEIRKCTSVDAGERARDRHQTQTKENRAERLIDQSPYLQRLLQCKHNVSSTGALNKRLLGRTVSPTPQKHHNQTTLTEIRKIYWPYNVQKPSPMKALKSILVSNKKRRALHNLTNENETSGKQLVPLSRSPKKNKLNVRANFAVG